MDCDLLFIPGVSHSKEASPCQDYAAVFPSSLGTRIAVSDGCSSALMSDLGARALVWAAGNAPFDSLADVARRALPLLPSRDSTHLLSTLVFLDVNGTTLSKVLVAGDGAVAWSLPDGKASVFSLSWSHNAPSYPVYLLSEESVSDFLRMGGTPRVRRYDRDGFDAPFLLAEEQNLEPETTLRDGYSPPLPSESVLWAAALSDGWESFCTQSEGRLVEPETCLKEIFSFKTLQGAFLRRRILRVFRSMTAFDDFSCACISLGEQHEFR